MWYSTSIPSDISPPPNPPKKSSDLHESHGWFRAGYRGARPLALPSWIRHCMDLGQWVLILEVLPSFNVF